jgi:hypothetical protein
MKMEALDSSETLPPINNTTRRHIPEHGNLRSPYTELLKSHCMTSTKNCSGTLSLFVVITIRNIDTHRVCMLLALSVGSIWLRVMKTHRFIPRSGLTQPPLGMGRHLLLPNISKYLWVLVASERAPRVVFHGP